MAKKKSTTVPATTILLVRHGQTPTTGTTLPGRAKGLHLAETGVDQAERAAERIGELKQVDAIYTSPLERARETAAPIGTVTGLRPKVERGLLECEFGEWTGADLKALMKLPEWSTVQRAPSTFRSRAVRASPRCSSASWVHSTRSERPTRAAPIVCVSHADPIKAAVAYALGTHLDLFQRIVISTCSISALAWPSGSAGGAPVALTVNSIGGSLADLRPRDHDEPRERVLRVRARRRLHHRCHRSTRRAGVLPPDPARQAARGREVREAAGDAIVQYLRRVLHDLPPPDDRPMAGALELATPVDTEFVLGPIGLGYDRRATGSWCSSRRPYRPMTRASRSCPSTATSACT
jgi:broad specificity phosphatase PhoE